MKKLDEISIKKYGIPGIVLMENAGLSVVNEIEALSLLRKTVSVVCGTGNNGGDGFVIARHLYCRDWEINVFICGDPGKIKGDALTNLNITKKLDIPIFTIDENSIDFFKNLINDSSLIVDALIGTGFNGSLSSFYKRIIEEINNSRSFIVSVDIPSGLNGDSGFADYDCVRAHKTVTFQLPKAGLLINDGPKACGDLAIRDIAIPKEAIHNAALKLNLIDFDMIKGKLPLRNSNTHKGSYGRTFIIAGSSGMTGAAVMSARASLKSGAGSVLLGVPESLQSIVSIGLNEIMTRGFQDNGRGVFDKACMGGLLEIADKSDSLLVGPGLTSSEDISAIVVGIIENCTVPVVIDADGLNAISQDAGILKKRKAEIIITPHPGEMARLMGCEISEVQADRIGIAQDFARDKGLIVVLKGYRTVVALPDGTIFINPTGNPGMATAGSGDVLAGIIAGFLAQGFKAPDAAICGVYIHGAAGDNAAEETGEYGLTAGDIIENISHTIKNITGK